MRLSHLLAAAALCAGCVTALADPVTYTLTGTFTGSLGSLSFTSTPGTISFTGDTSGIADQGAGFYTNTAGTSSITLDGIGTAVILSPGFGAYSASYAAGFYDMTNYFGADDYDPLNPAFANYALTASFTDTGYLLFGSGNASSSESTTLGDLTLDGDFGSSVTFTAASGSPALGATPEPSSFMLLGTGLLTVAGVAKRRVMRTPITR